MKSFKQYIFEAKGNSTMIPASTGVEEELPHGFSIVSPEEAITKPQSMPGTNKSGNKVVSKKPSTFAAMLARARELAKK